MTFAEYLHYTPPPGMRDELINGEILLSPVAKPRHQDICLQLLKLLERMVREEYLVRLDMTINLKGWKGKEGPRPDVLVIDRERWIEANQNDSYPVGSPQLIIEVKSPSNSLPELEDKVGLFLSEGALAVWIVDPEQWCVISYDRSGMSEWPRDTMVEIPRDLSQTKYGSIRVNEIFEGIVQ